ncbi:MAG: extracellular solute-binding protein [Sediminimonas sp.]|uniref:extracellular solute-binding protein n=1 Tax=Sediminimonas sp. TaxID=2823379 RepID=UPI00287004D7|nr:extracellular solute-binding protein [Sediminimonas sp.]MDR9483735.1 extracellular solute-binding protein [Sediminimonas sp.]
MRADFFHGWRRAAIGFALLVAAGSASAEAEHALAMYGEPALPPDFVSLPYANPDAPKGGRIVMGNTGGFNSLNPFVLKGTAPWQLRFLAYESLMGRNWDEPFSLYGLLAESVAVGPNREWVEFTLRPEARFSDGSPVTVEDVIWSYDILGRRGHPRYLGFAQKIETIAQTGPRSLRITFNTKDRELALIAGLRPILKKAQWDGRDFGDATLNEIPIGTAPYVVTDYEQGRNVTLSRDPDYWGRDLPLRRGTNNLDEIRIEFFADESVLFEAFKSGVLTAYRETNAEKWAEQYDFPAVQRGDIVKSEIEHQRPSGMTGYAMNTRNPLFKDWRVREAMLLAFNFDYINGTVTGGRQARITSYFSNSELAMRPGPAKGEVRALLDPFAGDMPPGAMDGYTLPKGDGTARNRDNLRRAARLLRKAGWHIEEGRLVNDAGQLFAFEVLLRQGDTTAQSVFEIYRAALARLGIDVTISTVDNAQFSQREAQLDFDMIPIRRSLSLSPGNEQRLYWGSDGAQRPGTRNLMGVESDAVDTMIDKLVNSRARGDFVAAARALDRALMAGRYVIPIWTSTVDRIAHAKALKYPENLPIYGDRIGWMPDVWWHEEQSK